MPPKKPLLNKATLRRLCPEVTRALLTEYPNGYNTKYVTTKYISQVIIGNPEDYPILSVLTEKHRKSLITTFLISIRDGARRPVYKVHSRIGRNGTAHLARIFYETNANSNWSNGVKKNDLTGVVPLCTQMASV